MAEQLLNISEVKHYLSLDDDEVMKLVREGKLNAFKIGGTYLRFDRNQVMTVKSRLDLSREASAKRYSVWSRIQDFFKFYTLYILTVCAVCYILYYFLVKT